MNNHNTKPAISVIVPVYKVEPYIHQCIDSILGQTFPDFELILVDDGSPDNCGAICDEYAKKDNRVVVIHQKNQGVSAARNAGLDIMRGEYIAFIDSDDYVSAEYLEVLYRGIVDSGADMAQCGFCWREEFGKYQVEHKRCTEHNQLVTGYELSELRYRTKIDIAAWAKLFARHLFSEIRFPVDKVFEDQAVIPRIFYMVSSAYLIHESYYNYRVLPNSISHRPFSIKFFDNILNMNDHIRFLKANRERKLYKLAVRHRNATLALYTIQAKRNGITEIPKGCRMSEIRALSIVRKHVSNDLFIWFLDSLHPNWVRPYAYFRKIESILTGKPLMGEN